MKKKMILLALCLGLAGCGKEIKSETLAETKTTALSEESDKEESAWSQEAINKFVEELEAFEPELTFSDMDADKAASYGKPAGETSELMEKGYRFVGRETEDGIGYVLGFQTGGASPLTGLYFYEVDDHTEAEKMGETGHEKPVYVFPKVRTALRKNQSEILYFEPNDMETPEELFSVFQKGDEWIFPWDGTEKLRYGDDIKARKVRLTPPSNGAYLEVDRIENGRHWWEFIPLTKEEEEEIRRSEEIIDPASYGFWGLHFHVSQERYEETGEETEPVTAKALEIAGERGRFTVTDVSEIRDIKKAEMTFSRRIYEQKIFTGETEEIRETLVSPEEIKELEEILSSAERTGEGKCPYSGILKLTREDGTELVLSVAMDSCDGFILGSHGVYSPGKEKTRRLWELFPKIRESTGWKTVEPGSFDGPGEG